MNPSTPPSPSRRLSFVAVIAGMAASLMNGCAAPPPTHWHTLLPAELAATKPTGAQPASRSETLSVSIAPVRLPAQVDRAQWLVRLPDGGVALLEQERWASPLADEIRLALAAALAARDGLVEAPAGTSLQPAVRVAVDIRRFESLPGREARIAGTWTLSSASDGRVSRCDFLYRESTTSAGFDAIADAHVRATSRLAAAIGDGVLGRAGCPPADSR